MTYVTQKTVHSICAIKVYPNEMSNPPQGFLIVETVGLCVRYQMLFTSDCSRR